MAAIGATAEAVDLRYLLNYGRVSVDNNRENRTTHNNSDLRTLQLHIPDNDR